MINWTCWAFIWARAQNEPLWMGGDEEVFILAGVNSFYAEEHNKLKFVEAVTYNDPKPSLDPNK